MAGKTWRQAYAPQIAEKIVQLHKDFPAWTWRQIRRELGRINPGPWGHQKRTWSSECTRQIQFWERFGHGAPPYDLQKKTKPPPEGQTSMF